MKILHISTGDSEGGAARAAYRIHRALTEFGINNRMRVLHCGTGDKHVVAGAPQRSVTTKLVEKLYIRCISHTQRRWFTDNSVLHTFGQIGARLVDELNASDANLLNLHWISNMLSVADIGRLKKPIVWTLHDMWAFCGGEHYVLDDDTSRFRQGYRADNRPPGEHGPDLNRRTWEAKCRAWGRQQFTIVCPSQWLARCARESVLFYGSQVLVIPNCLDTSYTWRPIPRVVARNALGLPLDKKLILFGADGGVGEPRKGGDLLRQAICRVVSCWPHHCELLIFGQNKAKDDDNWPCHVHWLGMVRDDRVLALAYSAADVMVVPSRQDNLPNTAVEAQACGTPVVGFNIGGLPDIVSHRETGWLAEAFNAVDMAEGLMWLIEDNARHVALATASRIQAVARFSEPVVAGKYAELYEHLLKHPRFNCNSVSMNS